MPNSGKNPDKLKGYTPLSKEEAAARRVQGPVARGKQAIAAYQSEMTPESLNKRDAQMKIAMKNLQQMRDAQAQKATFKKARKVGI